jgi:hypothetical protein
MKILCLYCASLSGDVLYPVVAAAPTRTRTIVHIAALTRTVIVVAAITVDVALHPPPVIARACKPRSFVKVISYTTQSANDPSKEKKTYRPF